MPSATPAWTDPGALACNLSSPVEVARRRWLGHLALGATLAGAGLFLAVRPAPAVRALLGLPAFLSALGYLQARRRLCVAYALRGVRDVGRPGDVVPVTDPAARAAQRRHARALLAAAAAVGAGVGLAAAGLG